MCLLVNIDPNSTSANDPTICRLILLSASRRRKASPRAIACELTCAAKPTISNLHGNWTWRKTVAAPDPLLNHGKHAEQNRSRQIYCCSERRLRGRHCLRVERYWVTRTARNSEARPATTNPAKCRWIPTRYSHLTDLRQGRQTLLKKEIHSGGFQADRRRGFRRSVRSRSMTCVPT